MDQIQIANILLTRRCNLRCDYCSIVRDYQDKPKEYPNMSYYRDHELRTDQWIRILDRLKLNNPNVFVIFYGGEPMLYESLPEIIKHCHLNNIYYTIISNNTEEVQPKILDLIKQVGKLRGFTASIDPELAWRMKGLPRAHSIKKTVAGFENLCRLKEQEIADDVVAEITATDHNIQYLYDTIKILSKNNIYSSITTIDLKKSPYYDFSTIDDQSLLVKPDAETRQIFFRIMADESLKVHIPNMLLKLYNILPTRMMCEIYKDISNVTIDADGSFRLCLRIRGIHLPKLSLDQIFSENGKVILPVARDAITKDYCESCKGCNWTCILFSQYYSKGIVNHG